MNRTDPSVPGLLAQNSQLADRCIDLQLQVDTLRSELAKAIAELAEQVDLDAQVYALMKEKQDLKSYIMKLEAKS